MFVGKLADGVYDDEMLLSTCTWSLAALRTLLRCLTLQDFKYLLRPIQFKQPSIASYKKNLL